MRAVQVRHTMSGEQQSRVVVVAVVDVATSAAQVVLGMNVAVQHLEPHVSMASFASSSLDRRLMTVSLPVESGCHSKVRGGYKEVVDR